MAKAFLGIVVFTILQRLYELRISKRNEEQILAMNGFIAKELNYVFMVALHSTWLGTILYFAIKQNMVIRPSFFIVGLIFFLIGQSLRIVAIKTLGARWTTKIAILPERPAVKQGIFKYIRHPNYLGVCLEIFALPLMGGLFVIAILFSVLNFVILFFRIRKEESLLREHNSYSQLFPRHGEAL